MKAKIYVGEPRSGKSRVARMISEHVGTKKTFWVSARKIRKDLSNIPFLFDGIATDTQLIVFDDCRPDFDYSFFFPIVHDEPDAGEFKFKIIVEEKGKERREMIVPQLIFITEKLDSKCAESASFNKRFDIVQFPIHDTCNVGNIKKIKSCKIDGFDDDSEFERCSKCDGHDACEDFGCAFKAGLGHLVGNEDMPF